MKDHCPKCGSRSYHIERDLQVCNTCDTVIDVKADARWLSDSEPTHIYQEERLLKYQTRRRHYLCERERPAPKGERHYTEKSMAKIQAELRGEKK